MNFLLHWAVRSLLLLLVALTACCPVPQAAGGAALPSTGLSSTKTFSSQAAGTETAFVAEVLELGQDTLLVRSEAAPREILSVSPSTPLATVGARVYVRGLLARGQVTRAEVRVLAARD